MFVNEKYIELEKEINLALFLKNSSYELEKIAVEINEKIVSKKDYETSILKNSDSLEIVWFVGGGWNLIKIELNGKEFTTKHKTVFELKNSINSNFIAIYNGYILQNDEELKENDNLVFIEKGKMPKEDELESCMASRHTPNVHKKLKASKVAIAGLGGLGSNIAVMLSRTGVGELLLIDFDIVEPSNLNRQSYYIRHLGMYKTDAIKEQLKEINPFIKVITETIKIDENNIKEL